MSEPHPTAPADPVKGANPAKPSKPYPEFPLTAHPAGYWCKKIRGKIHYFGPWADPDGALTKYNEQKDDLHAGRTPRPASGGEPTVKDAVNAFLNHKGDKRDAGELSTRTWAKYKEVTDLIVKEFGKSRLVSDLRADDFAALKKKMTKRWGPLRVADFIQHIRSVFKHALDSDLIERPVRFGPGFERPSQKTRRLHRAKQGAKLFTADEVRRLIAAAGPAMKAMILLGINAGLGNTDCGSMPLSAVNLDTGWIDYPRPKTGIPRRCPLWPETVEAIRAALAKRPAPKSPDHAGLVFITKYGLPWAKDDSSGPVTQEMRKLLRKTDINGHRNFYTLRHTFRTVADEAKDQPAADYIMGHEVPHMSSVYRETISDERLKAVAEHVRYWLYPEQAAPAPQGKPAEKRAGSQFAVDPPTL
jgi:integrase